MLVSVRTLKSQDVLTVEVNPSDTVRSFRKRFAASLHGGACKLFLRVSGRSLVSQSFSERLDPAQDSGAGAGS